MSTAGGRMTVSYLVRCALPVGKKITKQDANNNWYTYAGAIGLAPQWETGACDSSCQEAISACMMAHINTSGVHIPLWLDSPMTAIGWGTNAQYPNREGTFFGNLFTPNSAGTLDAFYCNGPGFDKDTVPGRLGVAQGNVPYSNPYINSVNTVGDCRACGSTTTDGPSTCPVATKTFRSPITVYRGQTFQGENATTKGGTVVNCSSCSQGKRLSAIKSITKITGVYAATTGSHVVIVYYTNGDSVSHTMQVDAESDSQSGSTYTAQVTVSPFVSFPPTGGWDKVNSILLTPSGFYAGTTNSIKFTPGTGGAPDLDWIEIE
ncbi:MAG TPA: hypothetical protein VNO55_00535 [Polyangia bacterium]|nr:hypothetical protein [Polyangia bacterium]